MENDEELELVVQLELMVQLEFVVQLELATDMVDAFHPPVLLQLQEFVIQQEQLDVFQFAHGFPELVQFRVQEQRTHYVLVAVVVGQELSPLYTAVKVLFILLSVYCTF